MTLQIRFQVGSIIYDPGNVFTSFSACGSTVTLSAFASITPSKNLWELLDKPDGSDAVLSDEEAQNPTFVADVAGTYRIRCTVNPLMSGQASVIALLGIKTANLDVRMPAAGEMAEAGARGWASALEDFIKKTDALEPAASSTTTISVITTGTTPGISDLGEIPDNCQVGLSFNIMATEQAVEPRMASWIGDVQLYRRGGCPITKVNPISFRQAPESTSLSFDLIDSGEDHHLHLFVQGTGELDRYNWGGLVTIFMVGNGE